MPMIPDISFGVLENNDVCNIRTSMHHLRKVAVNQRGGGSGSNGSAAVEATVMTTAAAAIPELRAEAVLRTWIVSGRHGAAQDAPVPSARYVCGHTVLADILQLRLQSVEHRSAGS